MPKFSAGLLLHRRVDDVVQVLLAHPGGPFWAAKDRGSWSIPKGEYDPSVEQPLDVARREFAEELGAAPSSAAPEVPLGAVQQPGGKVVTVYTVEGDFDASAIVSNTFEIEWPRKSGRLQAFPEVDRAEWMTIADAREKLLAGQVEFLDRLVEHLAGGAPRTA